MDAVIFNQSCWVFGLKENDYVQEFERLLLFSKFSIYGSLDHHFRPKGYSKIWLLGESHLAIHSFPEKNVLYIELSSCIKTKSLIFWNHLHDWLKIYSNKVIINSENTYQLLQ